MGPSVASLLLLAVALQSVFCYENAYDLAERRKYRPLTENTRHFNAERSYYNENVFPRTRDPSFLSRQSNLGNGYDNLGNKEESRFGQRAWQRYMERQDPFGYHGKWNTFYGDRFPFGRPLTQRDDNAFRRSDVYSGLFHDQDYSRPANTWEYRRQPISPPGQSSLGFQSDDLPRHRTVQPLPRPFLKPRIRPTTFRQKVPAFYRKNYFNRNAPDELDIPENVDDTISVTAGAGDAGFAEVDSFISSNEDREEKKSNASYVDNKEGAVSDVASKEKLGETTRFDKNGGNKSTIRVNRLSKKGHVTKGFATHHHKDETGNTTTFFDDFSDSGGQEDFQDQEDEFGTRRTMEVLNGREEGRFFKENGGRSGKFGAGSLQDKTKVEKDVLTKSNRYNKGESFNSDGDRIERGRRTESEYLGGGIWGDKY